MKTTINVNTFNGNPCSLAELTRKVYQLEQQLYKTGYKKALSGTNVLIPANIHKLTKLNGYIVLDGAGKEVSVVYNQDSKLNVRITSNVSMSGLTLTLY